MPYPEMLVSPMRAELTQNGFIEMKNPSEVKEVFENNQDKTMLVVVNSVCGCAAGSMRPGVLKSLQFDAKPSVLTTVFAGQDLDATAQAREYFIPFPPSSPSIALFKNGQLVHFVERHQIEGRTADMLAQNLSDAYKIHCAS
jgi:putative YphP/YqiW family bacilliredoxin